MTKRTPSPVMPFEVWHPIPSEPNYEASSLGRIRRAKSGPNTQVGRALKQQQDRGYLYVCTSHDGVVRRRAVHLLVAEAFIGPRPMGQVARHRDGDAMNNASKNLWYGTQQENILDKRAHGTMLTGERHPAVRLSDDEMLVVLRDARRIGQKPAGRKHGVHQSVISKILLGKVRSYLLERL